MNENFLAGLMTRHEDRGCMSHLRRCMDPGPSRVRGMALLASFGVRVSNEAESMPFKAVARVFAMQKATHLGNERYNFAHTLRKAFIGQNGESPFDKRFDAMVSCKSADTLIRAHLFKAAQRLDSDCGINYRKLLKDLQTWDVDVINRWIESYYGGRDA